MANERMNTFGTKTRSAMAACGPHAELGGREGRVTTRANLDWKQRGRTPLTQILSDSGREANRLWDLRHGTTL